MSGEVGVHEEEALGQELDEEEDVRVEVLPTTSAVPDGIRPAGLAEGATSTEALAEPCLSTEPNGIR